MIISVVRRRKRLSEPALIHTVRIVLLALLKEQTKPSIPCHAFTREGVFQRTLLLTAAQKQHPKADTGGSKPPVVLKPLYYVISEETTLADHLHWPGQASQYRTARAPGFWCIQPLILPCRRHEYVIRLPACFLHPHQGLLRHG